MRVFSYYQTADLLAHRPRTGDTMMLSADLGRTESSALILPDGIAITDDECSISH